MLREEDALRRSEAVQQRMQRAEESAESEWMDVAAAVQRGVVERHLRLRLQGVPAPGGEPTRKQHALPTSVGCLSEVEGEQGAGLGHIEGQAEGQEQLVQLDEESIERGLIQLRSAAHRHPEIVHYVRFNRARRGTLRVGSRAPDVSMRRASDGARVMLLGGAAAVDEDGGGDVSAADRAGSSASPCSPAQQPQPSLLVVLAGSYS